MPNAPIRRIDINVKEIKVETMVITTYRVNLFKMETINATTTSTGIIMVTEIIKVAPVFGLKIGKLLLEMVEVVWRELKICCNR